MEAEWSAAHWLRGRGLGRGSLVAGGAGPVPCPEVFVVTYVGNEVAVGRRVCLLRGGRGVACAVAGPREQGFQFDCQLRELTEAEAAAVLAWMERDAVE